MFLEDIAQLKREKYNHIDLSFYQDRLVNRTLPVLDFKSALQNRGLSIIAEVKPASPLKGELSKYSVRELAQIYKLAEADCVSVLTEEIYFLGSIDNISIVKQEYEVPVLMKDFIVTKQQIYEGFINGADCILLIAAILDETELLELYSLARELGLAVLLEIHSDSELEQLKKISPEIIGVNCRDLQSLEIISNNHEKLLAVLKQEQIKVAESGIHSISRAQELFDVGYDAILVGEFLVTAENPVLELEKLKRVTNDKD